MFLFITCRGADKSIARPSAKTGNSSRLDFFLDQDGILIDYIPKGQTINAEYYSSLLVWSLYLVSFLVGLRAY
jgi:hypothetical protein